MQMRLKDLINPKRWLAFIQGTVTNWIIPFHKVEQIAYRANQCKDCLEAGKCKHCGCHTPSFFYNNLFFCEEGKWGPFFSRKNWQKFKELMGL